LEGVCVPEDIGPEFVGPALPPGKLARAREAEGKTIRFIELGATFNPLGNTSHEHESEAMVLHFTDGTALLIQPGSNILNLSEALEATGISPSHATTDLIIHWLNRRDSGDEGQHAPGRE
jgi:hypothetical protein